MALPHITAVVPANAGTHNHQVLLLTRSRWSSSVAQQ